MRTIAIVNQKGGVGKTTVSINLASALAEMEQRTLLVDMDSQSHCAVGLAVPEEQIEQSIYDVLISFSREEPMRLSEILWEVADKLELAPASIDLSAFEQQVAGIPEREDMLKKVLDSVKDKYDYVIIDCPPAVGLLTFNALRAATDVIVPVETGYFSLHGLSKQLETLAVLCQRCKQNVNVRVLASMYDIRTKMAREILNELKSHFGDKMFKTVVNFNTKLKEAASLGQPISEYDAASKGHNDFQNLAKEVLHIGTAGQAGQQHRQIVESLSQKLEAISATADELLEKAKAPFAKAIPVIKPDSTVAATGKPAPADKTSIKAIESPKATRSAAESPLRKTPQRESVKVPTNPVTAKESPLNKTGTAEIGLAIPNGSAKLDTVPNTPPVKPDSVIASVPANTAPAKAPVKIVSTEKKLSEYYGVNQLNDAIAFVTLYPRAQSVQVAGDFNGWQPTKLPLEKVGETGVWQASVKLPTGKYRYRLVVDGQWQQDPYNEITELNPFGGYNSIVEVK
ncbi:MAG: AAA family ATPase [Sedimentisphaerales bacterium]